MKDDRDWAERIGTAVNQLDIDFSRLSIAGWLSSGTSLAVGGGVAAGLSGLMIRRGGVDLAAGLVFCFTMIAVTTATFLLLRWALGSVGISITRPAASSAGESAIRRSLEQLAEAGVSLDSVQVIVFGYRFGRLADAKAMATEARQMGFRAEPTVSAKAAPVEKADGSVDVQVRLEAVPQVPVIHRAERLLTLVAEKHGGRADGWTISSIRPPVPAAAPAHKP